MSIYFKTIEPNKLLSAFKKAIDDKEVVTWSYDGAGDFTHTPPDWKFKAWLRPVVYQDQLVMNFLSRNDEVTSKEVYAIYHGRFVESMLAHFDHIFESALTTALATASDYITKAA
jgi:hypothetical protein